MRDAHFAIGKSSLRDKNHWLLVSCHWGLVSGNWLYLSENPFFTSDQRPGTRSQ
jgi:hypothetical protein